MDNKPSLSQYFGETPPASQFFDEIGTSAESANSMIESVYLGCSEDLDTAPANMFPQTLEVPYTQQTGMLDPTYTNILPTLSGNSPVTVTNLPDPSTFFDNIGPEPVLGPIKSQICTPDVVNQAMEGLSIKNDPVDKDGDRRRDAWIPNDEAKKTLMKAQSSPKGSFFPEREVLTLPGLFLEEELADALHEAAVKHLGVSSAGSREVFRADHVSRDEAGLRELMRTGCLRAALNLSATLISASGQGKVNRPTKHTPRTLQLWLTRFALLVRIKMYDVLEKEAEAFGDFGKPDMYYQFYPDTYGARQGSLVPFSLRLLCAELPAHCGKKELAADRLYTVLDGVRQMLSNLNAGKTEDGSSPIPSEQDKAESIRLWTGREVRVLHSIINVAISLKDYTTATKLLKHLLTNHSAGAIQRRGVLSALCRLSLQAGRVAAAHHCLRLAADERQHLCPTPDVREYVDSGLLEIAHGRYQEAYNNFAKAADQEPTNIMVANNLSVCLLYMGKLKEAIAVLQKAINSDPDRGLNESLLINLCTLYELESSKTNEKKLDLLRMICKYKSDTIPNVLECLKLQNVA